MARMRLSPGFRTIAVLLAGLAAFVNFVHPVQAMAAAPATSPGWVTGWGEAPMVPMVPDPYVLPAFPDEHALDQTVRMVVRLTSPGSQLRLRVSNRYGDRPLHVGTVRIAKTLAGPAVERDSQRLVTFHGRQAVTVAPGHDLASDPFSYPVHAGDELSVSMFIPDDSGRLTFHRYGNWVSYASASGLGDRTDDTSGTAFQTATDSWFWLVGIDEAVGVYHGAVVALGDSITDGYPTIPDQHETWPDELAGRLQAATPSERRAVINAGIAGNCLESASFLPYGVSALRRIDADALDLSQVRDLIVFEGINDLGMGARATDLIAALDHLAATARGRGVRAFVATITPRSDSSAITSDLEPQRLAVNRWIRSNHVFDGVFDFDKTVRDPIAPNQLAPWYDSGDHVHPNILGLKAMADSIDLSRLS